MNSNREIFFHLGAKKAASTFFQRKVFPYLKGIQYFKKHHFYKHTELSPEEEGKFLFSFECLEEHREKLNEVLKFHKNPKFIYILREPSKWIVSYYKYYIRKHGYKDFDEFIRFDGNESVVDPSQIMFSTIIEELMEISPDGVLLLNFADFRRKPVEAIRKVANFMDSDVDVNAIDLKRVNKAFSIDQLLVLKRFNRFYKYVPSQSSNRAIRFIHYKYREFLLHIIAFFVSLFPSSDKSLDVLITPEQIRNVKKYYEEDWQKCLEMLSSQKVLVQ